MVPTIQSCATCAPTVEIVAPTCVTRPPPSVPGFIVTYSRTMFRSQTSVTFHRQISGLEAAAQSMKGKILQSSQLSCARRERHVILAPPARRFSHSDQCGKTVQSRAFANRAPLSITVLVLSLIEHPQSLREGRLRHKLTSTMFSVNFDSHIDVLSLTSRCTTSPSTTGFRKRALSIDMK